MYYHGINWYNLIYVCLQYCLFAVLFVIGFGLCLFLLYNLMPVVIKLSSATVVNLSLLTADFYSLFCGLFLFHYKVSYAIQWNEAVLSNHNLH